MANIPSEVTVLLKRITESLPVILGKNLVGIYVYGSLTQRAFKPNWSDIDCIVVTERDLSEAQFRRLKTWLGRESIADSWMARLQATFLIKNEILTMNAKACLYQFGQLNRSGSDGNPIIWMNVLKSGLVLLGPPPSTFVPNITRGILVEALRREAGYLREEFIEKPDSEWRDVPSYRVYAVLTLCRILYSFRCGTIVSKQRAGRWALKRDLHEWYELILKALEAHAGRRTTEIEMGSVARFIDFVRAEINPV